MPLSDLLAAIRWWAVLMVLGAAAMPLAFTLLRPLPDRGYAFVKMLGLLLVSYLFWILGSLGFMGNHLGGILFSLALLLTASFWAYRRQGAEIRGWVKERWRYLLTVELVFLVIFFLWAWVRAQNPAITGTEKPMEFAFLNAVGRSATFPPLDPWLSGYAISYYYFGYVMISVIARLAAVAEPVAFNLGIAWLVAGAAIGAFGLVYNLVAAGRPGARRAALLLALLAALALPLAGNLQILLEMLHAQGIGSAAFWEWLDVRDISGPATAAGFGTEGPRFWWWWRASRVIHEYDLAGVDQSGLEPIAEFPGFSFILGDMHPHVLALPFAFLSLAVALVWWLRPLPGLDQWQAHSGRGRVRLLLHSIGLPLWALTVLVLGGLSFLNTWDVLIHLFVVLGAFTLNRWQHSGHWHSGILAQGFSIALLLALPAILLYLPFYLGFRSQAGAPFLLPMLMQPTRLSHFLIIFGMPLLVVLPLLGLLVVQVRQRPWRLAVAVAGGLILALLLLMVLLGWVIAANPEGATRIKALADALGLSLPAAADTLGDRALWGLQAVGSLIPSILLARLSAPWLTLLLAALAGIAVMLWAGLFNGRQRSMTQGQEPQRSTLPFVLLLIFTAVLLTLGPEFVYLKDNFAVRLNTVFKFYYQAWVLFGVAALYALDVLWQRARAVAAPVTVGYGVLLAIAMLFPIYGATSRAAEYGAPPTLSGIAHYRQSVPSEYEALLWLRENVEGTPVIVETVGGQYSGYGRVSATTGLPTLLGWPGHEYQWRGSTPEPGEREPAVDQIYTHPDWTLTRQLLNRYGVQYIYVGPLERVDYGPDVNQKFSDLLEVAYANEGVVIYRWLPE